MGNLKSLARVCGEKQSPGINARIFAAECCDFDGWPLTVLETTPASTDADAEITLATAFTMKAGKTFKYFDIVLDTGKFTSEKIGEPGTEAFKNGVAFRIPGSKPLQVAAFAQIAKSCGVWVVETTNGDRFIIGTSKRPAHAETATLDSGAALTDPNGADYVISATNGLPVLSLSLIHI